MKDLKIKPAMDTPKAKQKNPAPKDADSILKQHMDKRRTEKAPESRDPVRYATDCVEKNMRRGTALAADGSRRMIKHHREKQRNNNGNTPKDHEMNETADGIATVKDDPFKTSAEHGDLPSSSAARTKVGTQTVSPQNPKDTKRANAAPQERGRQKAIQDTKAACRRNLAGKRTTQRHMVSPRSGRGDTMTTPQNIYPGAWNKSGSAPQSGRPLAKTPQTIRVRQLSRTASPEPIITRRARAAQRKAQRKMLQKSAQNSRKSAKKLGVTAVQAVKAVGRGVASAAGSILTAGGGTVVLVLLLTVILVAAIVASPFGILFSNESREAGVVPLSAAVTQVSYDFNERLEALQTADNYDSISVDRQAADWVEVLAVFAVKVAGSEDVDAADVATMDDNRIGRLKAVFWDMTDISHRVEVVDHPSNGEDDEGWTETNLYITISAKTAEEMKTAYQFSHNQITALEELLEQRNLLLELIEDAYSVSGNTAALLRRLPEDLSPEREAVVRTACSLVGKVNYFWGGKSLTLGWDSRWGTLQKVWADGSPTTNTYRPYGLDCSGYADWVFYNASGGEYIIGHGGGAHTQHGYCANIAWEDALPGDLVFYPEDTHVGIVGGRDEAGNLLIIHCASGYNNVVITGKEGFASVGRPLYFEG